MYDWLPTTLVSLLYGENSEHNKLIMNARVKSNGRITTLSPIYAGYKTSFKSC